MWKPQPLPKPIINNGRSSIVKNFIDTFNERTLITSKFKTVIVTTSTNWKWCNNIK